jgi:MFS family permease
VTAMLAGSAARRADPVPASHFAASEMSQNATGTGGRAGAQAGASLVLVTLAAGQFLMTLDTSGMNVAIATVAEDVGTDVTGIQTAITLYTLVMATLMITGGKVGALIGR